MKEYGFMGKHFPSQKFQRVMAEYLGHNDPPLKVPTEIGRPIPLTLEIAAPSSDLCDTVTQALIYLRGNNWIGDLDEDIDLEEQIEHNTLVSGDSKQ